MYKVKGEEKIMLTVQEAIRKIVKKFEDEDGYVRLTRTSNTDFDLTFNLEDEIEFMLTGLNLEHDVELIEAFEGYVGANVYYVLCVAYIYEGKLATFNIPVYG